MSVFGNYSRYYDLLYRDKDYQGEADFVASVLAQHVPAGASVLELGCGTGRHAALLAQKGYRLHGVDRSETMLQVAHARCAHEPRLSFSAGDVRDFHDETRYDAVISLFHVVSYQTTNDDLLAMFETAKHQLKPGGIFFFDYWYGPAVLSERPQRREKQMESDEISVVRIATPQMHLRESIVDVNYDVAITDKKTKAVDTLKETHRMRYLFEPELALLAQVKGFHVLSSFEWMTRQTPSDASWGVCTVLQA